MYEVHVVATPRTGNHSAVMNCFNLTEILKDSKALNL